VGEVTPWSASERAQLSAGSLARGRKRRLQLMTWALVVPPNAKIAVSSFLDSRVDAVSPQETISGLISPLLVNCLATSYFRLRRVS
jgi:hypothetical protein